ncbi:MAG TPA: YraN family protein [Desulfatirhabdiaceae bacterium]|nr:YraN family protein [Desulfatirhabdiaceae bacterium]
MQTPSQQFGKSSEIQAAAYLKSLGYQILGLNYRTRMGEIDIIARDHDSLVFVEVKARKSTEFGNPKHAVTRQKQIRLARAALYYLKSTRQMNQKARFDVVAIDYDAGPSHIELIQNAFESPYR